MTTATPTAEPGRRLTFSGYGSNPTPRPGVITGIDGDALLFRLDGMRSTLRITSNRLPASKSLHLLNEIGPVPALPMGRFAPTAENLKAETYEGVPVVELEDGDLAILSKDRELAGRALAAYAEDHDWVLDGLGAGALKSRWVAFEWEPEDSDYDWLMGDVEQGADQAVHVYYLSA